LDTCINCAAGSYAKQYEERQNNNEKFGDNSFSHFGPSFQLKKMRIFDALEGLFTKIRQHKINNIGEFYITKRI
jgi:hypothetical protein